jgi:hypothetical protein
MAIDQLLLFGRRAAGDYLSLVQIPASRQSGRAAPSSFVNAGGAGMGGHDETTRPNREVVGGGRMAW